MMDQKSKDCAEFMAARFAVRAKAEANFEKAEALTMKAMAWYEIASGNLDLEALDNE